MGKQSIVAGIGKILSPILLYYIIMAALQMVVGSIFPGLLVAKNTMWFLTVVNLGILPILLYMYGQDRKWRKNWEKNQRPMSVFDILLVVAGSICISRGANLLIGLTPLPYFFSGHESVMDAIYGGSLLSQIAASVLSAAVLEEVLMRGLLYGRLRYVTGNVKISMLASAIAFGVFHGNMVQGVYAFILGLFFVQVYERYRKLCMPIVAHMAANVTSILLEEFTWLNEWIQSPSGYYLQTAVFVLMGILIWKCIKERLVV